MLKSNSPSGNLVILKPVARLKDGTKVRPYFRISNKVDGKWTVSEDTSVSNVVGTLTGVEVKEEVWEDKPYDKVVVTLRDGDESYLIDMRFKISTRSLLNALINLKEYDNVEISYYENREGYDAFSVKQNGKKVDWKYSIEDIPKPVEVIFNKQKQKDYSAVDDFYKKEVEEFSQVLKAAHYNSEREEVVEVEGATPF